MRNSIKYTLFAQAFALQGMLLYSAATQNQESTQKAVGQVMSGLDKPESTLASNLEAELNEIPNISFESDNGIYKIYSNGVQIHSIDTQDAELIVGDTFLLQKALNPIREQLGLSTNSDCFSGQLVPDNEGGTTFQMKLNPIKGGCVINNDTE